MVGLDTLPFEPVSQLAARLRRRELTATELTDACLSRIDTLNPTLNAFITVTAARARERAAIADRELRAGTDRGPLQGIPFAVKDVVSTSGVRTTNGSRATETHVPSFDATVVERLERAGAVLVGKLNLWEFAIAGSVFGAVRNPWALDYSPGGSSSGSAAAVAAGLVPLAIGTDTGGSVRVPAAHCGITGLRPTYGRVSRWGVTANAWSVDTVGPMTRAVGDQATVLEAIAGADDRDPTCARRLVPRYATDAHGEIAGVRVGVPESFFENAHPDIEASVHTAIAVLERVGARIVPIALPRAKDAALLRTLHLAEAAAFHAVRLRTVPDRLGEEVRQRLERASAYSAVDYINALRLRRALVEEARHAFTACDVFAAPTDRGLPARLNASGAAASTYGGPNTFYASMTGIPALAVPCGFTKRPPALPVSLMLHARPFDEPLLFRVAGAFQRETDWHMRQPPLPRPSP